MTGVHHGRLGLSEKAADGSHQVCLAECQAGKPVCPSWRSGWESGGRKWRTRSVLSEAPPRGALWIHV